MKHLLFVTLIPYLLINCTQDLQGSEKTINLRDSTETHWKITCKNNLAYSDGIYSSYDNSPKENLGTTYLKITDTGITLYTVDTLNAFTEIFTPCSLFRGQGVKYGLVSGWHYYKVLDYAIMDNTYLNNASDYVNFETKLTVSNDYDFVRLDMFFFKDSTNADVSTFDLEHISEPLPRDLWSLRWSLTPQDQFTDWKRFAGF